MKRRMVKGCIGIILCTVMMVISCNYVFATQSHSENFASGYAYSDDPGTYVANIAYAQLGRTGSAFGYTEEWCADFASDCAKLAGQSGAVPANGSSTALKNNIISAGGYETSSPRVGDFVFINWNGGSGIKHTEIVYKVSGSTFYTVGGNRGSTGSVSTTSVKTSSFTIGSSLVKYIVRPAYAEESSMGDPVNVGDDFYAYIINTAGWKHLTCEDDGNVTIRTESGNLNQQWHFERLPDNSYKITNVWNEKGLDVDNYGTTNGTNLHTWEYQAADNQQFYIYGESGAYRIRAKCTECVFDVTGGNFDDGTNVQMWEINNTEAQLFQIWVLQEPPLNFNEIDMATIYNVESGKFLGVSENGYIELMNENGSSNQVWKFERFEDGSYTIRSAYNGKYLSVENNSDENFARLCLLDYNNLSGQRFKFYSQGNGYIIYPNCSLSRVVDCLSGNVDVGTPIQIYERNNTYAQIFRVYYSDDVQLKASELSCIVDKNNSSVTLLWNEAYGESNYAVEIREDSGGYYIYEEAKTPYNILLLAGNYTAKLYNKNYFYSIESNSIEFTISTPEPTTYAITLNANGGTINSGNITSYTYGIGATLPTDVTRECYNFLGWYDNEEYTGTAVTEISASETGDKTYYAQWEKAAPYIDASAEKDGTEYIVTADLHNNTSDCAVIAAGYSSGKLADLQKAEYTGTTATFTLTGEIDEIKIMVWDSISGMKPICEAVVIPSSEFIS